MATKMTLGPAASTTGDTIDMVEVVALFVVEWRCALVWALVTFVVGAAAIFAIAPLFEATASLLPPTAKESGSGAAAMFSTQSPGDVYVGLLESRSVADDVLDRAGLLELYGTSSRARARVRLAKRSTFTSGRDTQVVLKVRDGSAVAAARIANAYLEALEAQQERMAVHEAQLRRQFFEQQLTQETAALSAAEQELIRIQRTTGVVQPEAQTQLGLSAIAGARREITGLEVRLSGLLLGESESNSEVKELRAEIARLQAEERRLESSGGATGAGAAAAAGRMPELNLDYSRKHREVKYHEALVDSIARQYESARLGEHFAGAEFQVVDRAVPPEKRAWPPRGLLFGGLVALSGIVGTLAVTLSLLGRRILADPVQRERLRTVRQSFRPAR